MGEAMIETTTAQANTCPNELKNRTQITGYAVKNKDSHVSQGIRKDPILIAKMLLLVNHVHCISKKAVVQRQLTEPNKTKQRNLWRSTTHAQRT